jgi:hypothetical protein
LLEEVGEGVTVDVNGYQFQGPGVVVRQWPLTSVALCPYGYDSDTRAQFADRDDRRDELAVRSFSKGPPMSNTSTTAAQHADSRKEFAAELKRFTDQFGGEKGAKWYAEGKTFEASLEQQVADLTAAMTEKDAKIAELQKQIEEGAKNLSALKLGETSGVSSGEAEGGPAGKKAFSSVVRLKK